MSLLNGKIDKIMSDVDDAISADNMGLVEAKSFLEELQCEVINRLDGVKDDLTKRTRAGAVRMISSPNRD